MPEEFEEQIVIPEMKVKKPITPTTEANGDDLAGLFKGPSKNDRDMQTADLVAVSEEDVFGEGGSDMSDLTEVTDKDVMGEDLPGAPASYGEKPQQYRVNPNYKRPAPPSSAGGFQGVGQ